MTTAPVKHEKHWASYLADCGQLVDGAKPLLTAGRLTRVAGLAMEAVGLQLPVGSGCTVLLPSGNNVEAEVVGFSGERLFLMPQNDIYGLTPGARVVPVEAAAGPPRAGAVRHPRRRAADLAKRVPVGDGLLGRVLDAGGRPLDRLGAIEATRSAPLVGCSAFLG